MKISTVSIVSNSDMIKNYKSCRQLADIHGRIYILKNNQPDAVLLSIAEYERLSAIIEHTEGVDKAGIEQIAEIIKVDDTIKRV